MISSSLRSQATAPAGSSDSSWRGAAAATTDATKPADPRSDNPGPGTGEPNSDANSQNLNARVRYLPTWPASKTATGAPAPGAYYDPAPDSEVAPSGAVPEQPIPPSVSNPGLPVIDGPPGAEASLNGTLRGA